MSGPLDAIIKELIRRNGSLSVEAYWNLCLSHQIHGYYMKRDPLGAAGDFITAPEISQLFGDMIGIWAIEQWFAMGQPSAIYIVECGPGRGTLMADILRVAKVMPEFLTAAQIHLIEMSPSLQAKQGEALKGHQVVWHENLSTLPDNAPMIVIGNEFLDALPIQQYMFQDDNWFERVIGLNENDELIWGLVPSSITLEKPVEQNVVFEISPARELFISDISARMMAQGGAAVMIDYGHDITGFGDTLQAVRKHTYHDVLKDCGQADITSHVDFLALKNCAEKLGLNTSIQTQGDFLKRLGIEERAAQLMKKSDDVQSGLYRLVDDSEMGKLFKVLEILK